MGLNTSKLKKKRSQSILWGFRFPSMMSINRLKHKDLINNKTATTNQPASMVTQSAPGTPNYERSRMPLPPTPVTVVVDDEQPKPHLDIDQWLNTLDLNEYQLIFDAFNGVEDLLHYCEADIKRLGVKNASHRARIISSLLALKIKYEKGLRKLKNNTLRHSMAVGKRNFSTTNCIDDILNGQQSYSLCTLIMEPINDTTMDASALKKALEWELSLDTRDLCSHAWYHGAIPRPRAEEIIERDGEFLVRDCTSQPGNYVLSCRHKTQPLHFVINKVVIQPDTVYERVQYQFEDDAYDTVPDLITYYVGSGKPISAASGARIQYPRNRMYPLSFYASKYPPPYPQSRFVSPVNTPLTPNNSTQSFRYTSFTSSSNKQSPSRQNQNELRQRLPKKQRSQSLTPAEAQQRGQCQEKCNSADGIIQQLPQLMSRSTGTSPETSHTKFSSHSLPRKNSCTKISLPPNNLSSATLNNRSNSKHISRVTSDPSLSPCVERKQLIDNSNDEEDEDSRSSPPPPKPSRIPSIKNDTSILNESSGNDAIFHAHGCIQRVASYHASGSDSGNGSGDSAQSSAAGDPIIETQMQRISGVVIKNPRYLISTSESSTTLKNFDYASAEDAILQMIIPNFNMLEAVTRFDLENFHTLLLPATENKPLDCTALQSLKNMLKENGARILANHLTKIDLELTLHSTKETDNNIVLLSGIELVSLPHGYQIRNDIIERTLCLKLLVAVTILTCSLDTERAEILNKWIEMAIDIKTALGNLFGFCGIMLGLCSPQIQNLDSTWHILRQKHTDSAFNFEAKLRPTLKSMNECTNPQAPNTTIPHLLPIALIQERTLNDFIGDNQNEMNNSLTATCLSPWELKSPDFGLTTLFAHLEASRKFSENIITFKRNAEIILGETNRTDELMLDAFRTEFHLKFLWGSRGAHVIAQERHSKFEQVLKVLADKYTTESVQIGTTV